ncbi:MAG: hypothetical protein DLM72_12130 [Candidatus Nitrosopolaris wilkensis]|nr:MAG: hypothetical protein DLM72_12130 [Candidatus Nitrosopolaris wilkensis]
MNRQRFALVSIIAVAGILVTPNAAINFANASSCSSSSQSGSAHSSRNFPPANTGSCATSTAASAGKFSNSGLVQNNGPTPGGGKNGACETRSASSSGVNLDFDLGQGSSVSCSSHSP